MKNNPKNEIWVTEVTKEFKNLVEKETRLKFSTPITHIYDNMFMNASFKSIILPFGVKTIGYAAFAFCHNLSRVILPKTVETISPFAFSDCPNLKNITIPNGVKTIGICAFQKCNNLTNITLANSIEKIEDSVFACSGLTSVTIPDTVTSIGEYAFGCCSRLSSANIPNSVTYIGNYAFYQCSGLTSVTYKGVTYTSKSELIKALETNGVKLGVSAFWGTKLMQD